MKSILQKNEGMCLLCSILHGDDHEQFTHCHHVIYGTAGRKLSEKYGLKVYLCPAHHEFSDEAVHRNREINLMLKKAAEIVFITRHSYDRWMKVFGKNYLEDHEMELRAESASEAINALIKPKGAAVFEIVADMIPDGLPF